MKCEKAQLFLNNLNKRSKDGLVMSIYDHEKNRRLVVPLDRARQGETVLATARSPKRLVSKLGSELSLVFMIAGGAMGLNSFASHVSKQDQKHADTCKPGGACCFASRSCAFGCRRRS